MTSIITTKRFNSGVWTIVIVIILTHCWKRVLFIHFVPSRFFNDISKMSIIKMKFSFNRQSLSSPTWWMSFSFSNRMEDATYTQPIHEQRTQPALSSIKRNHFWWAACKPVRSRRTISSVERIFRLVIESREEKLCFLIVRFWLYWTKSMTMFKVD